MNPYGHASTSCVLRRRGTEELLPGGRAARGHPAGCQLADPVARAATRSAAPGPLRSPGRADRGRETPLRIGSGRRHRGVAFEPFFRDEVVLACPADHRFAGKTVSLDDLKGQKLIVMQEGAGVRQVIEDELRKAGMRLRDLDVRLELGLQESARSAVLAGHGVTFISRLAIEADLAAGRLATARVRDLDPVREIFLARAGGRSETRAARAFLAFARERVPA